MSAPLVLMMAGGTGGHVYPALAVAQELLRRGFRVEWLGTSRGLEARVVPSAGITLHPLAVRGVRGKSLSHRLQGLGCLALAALQALWLLARLRPGCVVGLGGYAAGPGGLGAWLLRRPLVIHEQNAVAGTTNRLLAPLARRILCGFPAAFDDRVACEVVGNPLRRELLQAAQERPGPAGPGQAGPERDPGAGLRLLVLGGSLGAQPINELVPAAVRRVLAEAGEGALEVWHQSGVAHLAAVEEAYGSLSPGPVRVSPFIEEMAVAYRWADLVLCRAGALTISELALMGCPAILVPLPHAIDDHQTANARYLSDVGGAVLQPQNLLSAEKLARMLLGYLENPLLLQRMREAVIPQARPGATAAVCDVCEEVLRG